MAVVIKKNKVIGGKVFRFREALGNRHVIFANLASLGFIALLFGLSFADKAPRAVGAPAAVSSKASPYPDTKHLEAAFLHAEASRLVAAILAYKEDKLSFPKKLSDLTPLFLADTPTNKNLLSKWTFSEENVLRRAGLGESACRQLTDGSLAHIDHALKGLSCVASEDDKTFTALYRIDSGKPPLKGFWQIELKGALKDTLSTWKIVGNPKLTTTCTGDKELSQQVELNKDKNSYSQVLCIPAYEEEVKLVQQGISLLGGSEQLIVQGSAMDAPWALRIQAQACDFGRRVVTRLDLSRQVTSASTAPSLLSCDLKPLIPT